MSHLQTIRAYEAHSLVQRDCSRAVESFQDIDVKNLLTLDTADCYECRATYTKQDMRPTIVKYTSRLSELCSKASGILRKVNVPMHTLAQLASLVRPYNLFDETSEEVLHG